MECSGARFFSATFETVWSAMLNGRFWNVGYARRSVAAKARAHSRLAGWLHGGEDNDVSRCANSISNTGGVLLTYVAPSHHPAGVSEFLQAFRELIRPRLFIYQYRTASQRSMNVQRGGSSRPGQKSGKAKKEEKHVTGIRTSCLLWPMQKLKPAKKKKKKFNGPTGQANEAMDE